MRRTRLFEGAAVAATFFLAGCTSHGQPAIPQSESHSPLPTPTEVIPEGQLSVATCLTLAGLRAMLGPTGRGANYFFIIEGGQVAGGMNIAPGALDTAANALGTNLGADNSKVVSKAFAEAFGAQATTLLAARAVNSLDADTTSVTSTAYVAASDQLVSLLDQARRATQLAISDGCGSTGENLSQQLGTK